MVDLSGFGICRASIMWCQSAEWKEHNLPTDHHLAVKDSYFVHVDPFCFYAGDDSNIALQIRRKDDQLHIQQRVSMPSNKD